MKLRKQAGLRWLPMVLVTALAATGIGWLSRAPYDPPGNDAALLRLSWRFRAEASEQCRPRTQAELDALPVHMRTPEICEKELHAYLLVLRIDDGAADTLRVLPGGLRADRPAYVLRDTALAPGPHRIHVSFFREDTGAGRAPPALQLDTALHMTRGAIDLITLDAPARRLVVRRAAASSGE
ncbi:MAG TPA: hypothetical protein VFZ69_08075 [Longimicrobiales bacterium]